MLVATTIMGLAIVGLMAGLSGATRNASRLRDYDRVVQLARLRMNDILADPKAPRNTLMQGVFPPELVGGLQSGWRGTVTLAEKTPLGGLGAFSLDRVQVDVWWISNGQRRTLSLESYRKRELGQTDTE